MLLRDAEMQYLARYLISPLLVPRNSTHLPPTNIAAAKDRTPALLLEGTDEVGGGRGGEEGHGYAQRRLMRRMLTGGVVCAQMAEFWTAGVAPAEDRPWLEGRTIVVGTKSFHTGWANKVIAGTFPATQSEAPALYAVLRRAADSVQQRVPEAPGVPVVLLRSREKPAYNRSRVRSLPDATEVLPSPTTAADRGPRHQARQVRHVHWRGSCAHRAGRPH